MTGTAAVHPSLARRHLLLGGGALAASVVLLLAGRQATWLALLAVGALSLSLGLAWARSMPALRPVCHAGCGRVGFACWAAGVATLPLSLHNVLPEAVPGYLVTVAALLFLDHAGSAMLRSRHPHRIAIGLPLVAGGSLLALGGVLLALSGGDARVQGAAALAGGAAALLLGGTAPRAGPARRGTETN